MYIYFKRQDSAQKIQLFLNSIGVSYIEVVKKIKEHNRGLEHHLGPHIDKTMLNVSFKGNGLS